MRGVLIFAALVAVAASENEYVLTLGEPVDLKIGSDDVYYCILQDHFNTVFHEGFGPCRIQMDRVTKSHSGVWKAKLFKKDGLEAETVSYNIITEPRPHVKAYESINEDKDEVTLFCQIKTRQKFSMCKFRRGTSQLFVTGTPGDVKVDDGYTYASYVGNKPQEQENDNESKENDNNNKEIDYESTENEENDNESKENDYISEEKDDESYYWDINCMLKISKPKEKDFGIWRCGIEVETNDLQQDAFFGFVTLSDYKSNCEGRNCHKNPILRPRERYVNTVARESFSMACQIDQGLDFCFFRDNLGNMYNVESGTSTLDYEYIGDGLDAGDCGIRIHSAELMHSGKWTCNAGSNRITTNAQIDVRVQGLEVSYSMERNSISITASLHENSTGSIELCRFVNARGDVIVNGNFEPDFIASLSNNVCSLTSVGIPNSIAFEGWLVAARVTGYANEFTHQISRVGNVEPPATPRPPSGGGSSGSSWSFYFFWRLFFGLLILGFMLTLIALMLKDRKWVSRRNNSNRHITNTNGYVTNTTDYTNTNAQVTNSNIVTIDANNLPVYVQANPDPRLIDEKTNLP